jgi:ribonuclease P protein component
MLKKPYRLTQSARFLEIKRKGESSAHPLVILTKLPNGLPVSRFGFVVSRRMGKAVERNRAKRLMREAIRLRLPTLVSGYDVVLIARLQMRGAAFGDVDQAIARLTQRAGLVRRSSDGPAGESRPVVSAAPLSAPCASQ